MPDKTMIRRANPRGFWTLYKRETMRYLKVYVQTLLSPLISNLLFLAVFGGMFATREIGFDGVGYLPFLVPGLCMMGAINGSFPNPASSIIIQKYQNLIHDLNSYPITDGEKTFAYVLAGMLRGLTVGMLTYVATIPFAGASIAHPVGFVAMLALAAFLFSSLGLIVGLVADTFDTINFAHLIIITPLTYLGGVFFEITRLPGMFSRIARINPIFPLVDATRTAYLGVGEGSVLAHLSFAIPVALVCVTGAYFCIRSGVGVRT